MTDNKTQYWIVGATHGDDGDQTDTFVSGGYWMLGWDKDDNPMQAERCKQIRPGDRIAIKKLQGQGATQMTIRHIGIVRGVVPFDYSKGRFLCTVDWLNKKDMNRSVDVGGCMKAINAPHSFGEGAECDAWLRSIFCL